jgi:hypothetical protein
VARLGEQPKIRSGQVGASEPWPEDMF